VIGGIDIRIPTKSGDLGVEVAARAIIDFWPDAVFEDATTADWYNDFVEVPFAQTRELFVYRDPACADIWDAEGAIPEAYNTMIQLIGDDGLLTVVVDGKDGQIDAILAAIQSALEVRSDVQVG
jgi:hypothetical protein